MDFPEECEMNSANHKHNRNILISDTSDLKNDLMSILSNWDQSLEIANSIPLLEKNKIITNCNLIFIEEAIFGSNLSDILTELKSQPNSTHIHIILLLREDKRKAASFYYDMGVDEVLYLPVIKREYEVRLQSILTSLKAKEDPKNNRSSDEFYKMLLDATYDWEYFIDKEGILRYCSQSCERITGYSATEFLENQNLLINIIEENVREEVTDHIINPFNKTKTYKNEFIVEHKNGDMVWVAIICKSVYNFDGEYIGKRVSNRDVTEQMYIQQLLIESENKFHSIFHNAPLGIFRSTPQGKFIEVNPALAEMLGYGSPKEVLDSVQDIAKDVYVSPAKRSAIVDEVWGKRKINQFVNIYKRKDASQFTANLYLTTINDSSGNPLYFEGIVEDITDQLETREKLEENERKFKLLFDMIPVLAIITEKENGEIIDVNQSFLQSIGYEKEFLIGKRTTDLPELSLFNREDILPLFEQEGETVHFEIKATMQSGNMHYFQISSIPISIADKSCFLSAAIDVTEIREAEIKHEETELALKDLNETKDKFFSIIAHDLKNPFQALIGLTDALYSMYNRVSDEDRLKYLFNIKKAAKSAYELVENLLQWSRSQRGTLNPRLQKLQVSEIIENIIDELLSTANNKNITIVSQVSTRCMIIADMNLFATVIRNLLTNAIKFSHSGGVVTIDTQCHSKYVHILVQDDGIGINQSDLENIFTVGKFDSRRGTCDERGTGLGLPVCREFIKEMNGTISVESKEGKGSTFILELPNANANGNN